MKEKSKEKLITIERLAVISGVKLSIISSYVKEGILQYEKQDNAIKRYYNEDKTLQRLKEIKEAKKEGYSMKEMKEYFRKKDAREFASRFINKQFL